MFEFEWPTTSEISSMGTPWWDITETAVCLVSRSCQPEPIPAFSHSALNLRRTAMGSDGFPARLQKTRPWSCQMPDREQGVHQECRLAAISRLPASRDCYRDGDCRDSGDGGDDGGERDNRTGG